MMSLTEGEKPNETTNQKSTESLKFYTKKEAWKMLREVTATFKDSSY